MASSIDKNEGKRIYDEKTAQLIDGLHKTAAIEALGAYEVFEAVSIGSEEKPRVKYIRLSDREEVINALNWIAEYGDFNGNLEENRQAFFAVRRVAANHKFYESLVSRFIGKPVEEVSLKAEVSHLTSFAKKAYAGILKQGKNAAGAVPSYFLLANEADTVSEGADNKSKGTSNNSKGTSSNSKNT